jgi:UDP-N-acetylglucosamine acyltransferase
VKLGRGTVIESNAVVDGDTTLGERNRVFPFSSIGLVPQDLKFQGEPARVVIGDRNVFREGTTVHRGTAGGGALTSIGSDNLFMAQVHIAHDCHVGNHTIFANAAGLAGHVDVADYATIGAYSAVHQFCRVGTHAFIGGCSVITRDVLPYSLTVGNRAHLFGANVVGLKRRGFSSAAIAALRRAFRELSGGGRAGEVLARLEAEDPTPEVRHVIEFVRGAKRGAITQRRRRAGASEDAEP